jgi:hypothetical protein
LATALRVQKGLALPPTDATHFDKKALPVDTAAYTGEVETKTPNTDVPDMAVDTTTTTRVKSKTGLVAWVRSLFGAKTFEVL